MSRKRKADSARRALPLLAAVLTAAGASPAPAEAQGARDLEPGTRIRLTVITDDRPQTYTGTLEELAGDTLRLSEGAEGDERLAVPFVLIRRLEVSAGKRSQTWTGAGMGALIGGVGLGAAAAIANDPCSGWLCFSTEEAFAFGFLAGTVPGALLGAVVGSQIKTDRWQEHPRQALKTSVWMGPGPEGPRLALGATLRL